MNSSIFIHITEETQDSFYFNILEIIDYTKVSYTLGCKSDKDYLEENCCEEIEEEEWSKECDYYFKTLPKTL